jgi:hypothetical protein
VDQAVHPPTSSREDARVGRKAGTPRSMPRLSGLRGAAAMRTNPQLAVVAAPCGPTRRAPAMASAGRRACGRDDVADPVGQQHDKTTSGCGAPAMTTAETSGDRFSHIAMLVRERRDRCREFSDFWTGLACGTVSVCCTVQIGSGTRMWVGHWPHKACPAWFCAHPGRLVDREGSRSVHVSAQMSPAAHGLRARVTPRSVHVGRIAKAVAVRGSHRLVPHRGRARDRRAGCRHRVGRDGRVVGLDGLLHEPDNRRSVADTRTEDPAAAAGDVMRRPRNRSRSPSPLVSAPFAAFR